MKEHCSAAVALMPKIFWRLPARENRIDPGTDIVGNPVHGLTHLGATLVMS